MICSVSIEMTDKFYNNGKSKWCMSRFKNAIDRIVSLECNFKQSSKIIFLMNELQLQLNLTSIIHMIM